MTTRSDIIKHFKKLAEHSTFLQYAAESAERIGWALEVNLRDNRGRVILQLGSEPGAHWVSNLPGECVTGVAWQAPSVESEREVPTRPSDFGSDILAGFLDDRIRKAYGLPPLPRVGEPLIHRNGASDGTGPARAARRARAEAAASVVAGAQAQHGAEEAALDACVVEMSPEERFIRSLAERDADRIATTLAADTATARGETFKLPPAKPIHIHGMNLRNDGKIRSDNLRKLHEELRGGDTPEAKNVRDALHEAFDQGEIVATASLSVEAMESVRPWAYAAEAVEYRGLYAAIDGTLIWCWLCRMNGICLGVWVGSRETIRMTDPNFDDNWTLVKQP